MVAEVEGVIAAAVIEEVDWPALQQPKVNYNHWLHSDQERIDQGSCDVTAGVNRLACMRHTI